MNKSINKQATVFLQVAVDEKTVLMVPVNTTSNISLSFLGLNVKTPSRIVPQTSSVKQLRNEKAMVKQVENPPEQKITRSPPLPKAYAQYQIQHEQLCKMGFVESHKNFMVLRQTNGDLSKALEILMQTTSRESHSDHSPTAPIMTTPIVTVPVETQEPGSDEEEDQRKPDIKFGPKHRMLQEKYREQCDALLQRGHENIRRNLNVLGRCSGDMDQALAILEKSRARKSHKHSGCRMSDHAAGVAQENRHKEQHCHPDKFANHPSHSVKALSSFNQRGCYNQRK